MEAHSETSPWSADGLWAVAGEPADIVDEFLLEADTQNASDIHLVPQADGLLVRLRIDGVVRDFRTVRRRRPWACSPA